MNKNISSNLFIRIGIKKAILSETVLKRVWVQLWKYRAESVCESQSRAEGSTPGLCAHDIKFFKTAA